MGYHRIDGDYITSSPPFTNQETESQRFRAS